MQDLLKYQQADTTIRKNNSVIEGCSEKKEMATYKVKFDEAKKNLLVAESNADKIVAAYNGALAYFEKVSGELNKLLESLESAKNKEEVIAKLQDLKTKVADANAKVKAMAAKADEAIKLYVKANNDGKSSRENFNKAKESYDNKVNPLIKENEELSLSIDALKAKVNKKDLEIYEGLIAQNIIPPFVEVLGEEKGYMCGGCYMALLPTTAETLKNTGRCTCDNCKRIIYKK